MRQPLAQAGRIFGGHVVAGMGIEQDAGLAGLLLIAGPQEHGDRDARKGRESEGGVGQAELLTAQSLGRPAEVRDAVPGVA